MKKITVINFTISVIFLILLQLKEMKGNINIEVYDIYGKAIYKDVKEGTLFTVDIPDISTGVYIVKVSSGEYIETIRFIKE